jgi:hypothetical protein
MAEEKIIALIYGGWIHQLKLDVGGNLSILCLADGRRPRLS